MKILPTVWFKVFDDLMLSDVVGYRLVNRELKQLVDLYLSRELKIKQIACGLNHTVILMQGGRVFAMGSNRYKQLGLDKDENQFTPVEIPVSDRIQSISAGFNHTLLLGKNNTLWFMGSNAEKQFSFQDLEDESFKLQKYNPNEGIESAYTYDFTVAIAQPSGIHTYGFDGLLAHQIGGNLRLLPPWLALPKDKNIVDVCFGSTHALLLTQEGQVFGFGTPIFLGQSSEEIIPQWTLLSEKKVRQIHATTQGSLLLTDQNELLVAGMNTEGQFGKFPARMQTFTTIALRVMHFAAHTSHTVYVDEMNQLHAMGNNAKGALGVGIKLLQNASPPLFLAINQSGPSLIQKMKKTNFNFQKLQNHSPPSQAGKDWSLNR